MCCLEPGAATPSAISRPALSTGVAAGTHGGQYFTGALQHIFPGGGGLDEQYRGPPAASTQAEKNTYCVSLIIYGLCTN